MRYVLSALRQIAAKSSCIKGLCGCCSQILLLRPSDPIFVCIDLVGEIGTPLFHNANNGQCQENVGSVDIFYGTDITCYLWKCQHGLVTSQVLDRQEREVQAIEGIQHTQ